MIGHNLYTYSTTHRHRALPSMALPALIIVCPLYEQFVYMPAANIFLLIKHERILLTKENLISCGLIVNRFQYTEFGCSSTQKCFGIDVHIQCLQPSDFLA